MLNGEMDNYPEAFTIDMSTIDEVKQKAEKLA